MIQVCAFSYEARGLAMLRVQRRFVQGCAVLRCTCVSILDKR